MANGDLYTVGTELQNILARRKAEARQSMLDQLAQEKFEQEELESDSRMKNDSIQAEAWKAQREAYAEAQLAQADERRAKILDQAPIDPGTEIDPTQFTPEDLEFAKRTQRIKAQPSFVNPQGETDETVEAPRTIWQGNAEQREDLNQKRQRESFIQELMKNPNTNKDMINRLRIAATFGGDLSAADLRAITESATEPFYSVDRSGKPVFQGNFPKGSVFRQEPAPPREPVDPSWRPLGLSADGKSVVWVNPKTREQENRPLLPNTGPIQPTVTQSNSGLGVANRVFNETSLRAYSTAFQDYANLTRRSPGSPAALNAQTKVQSLGRTLALNANLPQDVKEWVVGIIEDDDRRTTTEIMNELKAQVDPNNSEDQHKLGLFWQALKTIRQE